MNAKLKLIAGDVNTVQQTQIKPRLYAVQKGSMPTAAAPSFTEKSFADYHLYTLDRPVTLN